MVEPLERDACRGCAPFSRPRRRWASRSRSSTPPAPTARRCRLVTEAADLCLLPARPTRLTWRRPQRLSARVFLAKRKAAFVLNQCPPNYRSSRASEAAKALNRTSASGRADAVDAHGLSGCDRCRPRRHRICALEQGGQEIATLWKWSSASLRRANGQVERLPLSRTSEVDFARNLAVLAMHAALRYE